MNRTMEDQLREHLRREAPNGIPAAWIREVPAPPQPALLTFESSPGEHAVQHAPQPSEQPHASNAEPRGEFESLSLDALREVSQTCQRCRLCEGRNRVVFGVGNAARPLIAFVGEGPGADEDRIGEPFVGKAGQLLTAAITKGLGMRREDVYIANVVKCRPPENRAPLPDEAAACTPYLFRQLEIIQPRVIVTLGQPAQLALSGVQMGITKLRGNWQDWRGIRLMPTFHPAYLLRNPPAKKFFWEDLKSVLAELGLPVPNSGGNV